MSAGAFNATLGFPGEGPPAGGDGCLHIASLNVTAWSTWEDLAAEREMDQAGVWLLQEHKVHERGRIAGIRKALNRKGIASVFNRLMAAVAAQPYSSAGTLGS